MSYELPILVPGATGHDDVSDLRGVVEDLASQNAIIEYLPIPVRMDLLT